MYLIDNLNLQPYISNLKSFFIQDIFDYFIQIHTELYILFTFIFSMFLLYIISYIISYIFLYSFIIL